MFLQGMLMQSMLLMQGMLSKSNERDETSWKASDVSIYGSIKGCRSLATTLTYKTAHESILFLQDIKYIRLDHYVYIPNDSLHQLTDKVIPHLLWIHKGSCHLFRYIRVAVIYFDK